MPKQSRRVKAIERLRYYLKERLKFRVIRELADEDDDLQDMLDGIVAVRLDEVESQRYFGPRGRYRKRRKGRFEDDLEVVDDFEDGSDAKKKEKEMRTSKGGHKEGDDDDDLLGPNYMKLIEELNNKKAKQYEEQIRHNQVLNNKKAQQYEEQIRHNQVMEDAAKWKAQNDKLEYKMNLIKKYGELKELGLSKAQIAKQFPEMMHLIEDDDDDVDA